ncbi:MAG: XRE family transcriptional regulator [Oscillospiraceae bacterium]
MSLADNIKELRTSHKLSQAEFGKIAGVSDKAVSTWENGEKTPRMGAIQKLADHFGISKSDIIEDKPVEIKSNISYVIDSKLIHKIPVFESVSAGFGAYASSEIIDYIPVVINNGYDVDDTIAIKVKGDSMCPKIEDGDIIVVRRQTSVDSGDIAVVLLDGDEGLVKKVVYGPTWIELQSINEDYPVQRFENAEVTRLRVAGKVMQIIKTL